MRFHPNRANIVVSTCFNTILFTLSNATNCLKWPWIQTKMQCTTSAGSKPPPPPPPPPPPNPTHPPKQNGRNFPDDIFKSIFFNEIVRIAIEISLKFVSKGPFDNMSVLVPWLIYAELGRDELNGQVTQEGTCPCSISMEPWLFSLS